MNQTQTNRRNLELCTDKWTSWYTNKQIPLFIIEMTRIQTYVKYTLLAEIEYNICSVWSKMGIFTWVFWYAPVIRNVLGINETFQMRYCTKFYLKGHQNYNKSKSKVPVAVLVHYKKLMWKCQFYFIQSKCCILFLPVVYIQNVKSLSMKSNLLISTIQV